MKINNFWYILFTVLIYSCTKDPLDYILKIPPAESKLCMSGFVSTDSIYVLLTRNLPRNFNFSGGNPTFISDTIANIIVFENNVFFCNLKPKTFIVNKGNQSSYLKVYYTSYKKTTEGSTYTINVTHKDYESINAEAYLPPKVPILSVDTFTFYQQVQFVYENKDSSVLSTMFTINFQDPGETKNYYRIEVINNKINKDYIDGPNFNDPIIEYTGFLFSDKYIQGKKYGLKFSVFNSDNDSLTVKLYSVNEAFYKYGVSLDKYNDTKYDTYREPVPIYSNINNGIGIIGGYSVSSKNLLRP